MNDMELLVPPAVLTVTPRMPVVAVDRIVKLVVSCVVPLTLTEPTVTPAPLTTTEVLPVTKFVPVRMTVLTAVPAMPLVGEI